MHPTVSEHARFIHAVVESPEAANGAVRTEIGSSWRRCLLDYRLDPDVSEGPAIVDEADLKQRQERLALLVDVAKSEMVGLVQQISGSGHAVVLTDLDGVILNYASDPRFADTARRDGLRKGAIWSEASQGTNGIGTCIAEQKPMLINHQEHFLSRNRVLTCAASPIWDPRGEMLAVLDATSESNTFQHHTMALVSMSAQMIENRLFLRMFRDRLVVRFHSRPEFVSILGEGAIAIDEAGIIRGANRSAAFQLDSSHEALIGASVESVFAITLSELCESAGKRPQHPEPLYAARDGRRFFCSVQGPSRGETVRLSGAGTGRGEKDPIQVSEPDCLDRLDLGDPTMARNIRRARRLLNRNIPLLLCGETGTGKGVFARAFHDASNRSDKPFVAVNCASIPETLIESELFGYRPGAFTGASRRGSRGKIAQANGGTLFLDEIGDMPLHLQARLLRVLEEKEVVPLGGEAAEKVDVAVISATHRDLETLIGEGRFREDLYYRLHGMVLTMPPLRTRHDVRELVREIVRRERADDEAIGISEEALELLVQYDWPGNIRQLYNCLRTVLALCDGPTVRPEDLPDEVRRSGRGGALADDSPSDATQAAEDPLAKAERCAIQHELAALGGNVSQVARKLRLSRNTLYRKIKQHGIKVPR